MGILGLGRAPARAAVRSARSARPVRRVPGHDSARPVQHREPRTGRRDPARGIRRQPPRLDDCSCRESVLARVLLHDPLRLTGFPTDYDVAEIEARLVDATRAWTDDLRDALVDRARRGARTELCQRYERRVSARLPRRLAGPLRGRRHRTDRGARGRRRADHEPVPAAGAAAGRHVRCKLFSSGGSRCRTCCPRSSTWARKVVDERPYEISPSRARRRRGSTTSGCGCDAEDVERVRDLLPGRVPRRLARRARGRRPQRPRAAAPALTGREITIVRAIAKYLRQAGIAFSDAYMERTLLAPSRRRDAAGRAVLRPVRSRRRDDADRAEQLARRDRARRSTPSTSLDEDRILRSFLSVVRRDAAHQLLPASTTTARRDRTCRSSSTRSRSPLLPLPRPQFEIFVYSPRVEGVHLRGGKVARGGLRWSDRPRGLPHRGPRPDEGADGQERADRAGRLQGRLRGQAPAGGRRPRGAAGGGDRLLPAVPVAGCSTSPTTSSAARSWPPTGWSATTTTTRTWWSPPTRAPRPSPTSPTRSRRATASGWATRSPPGARRAMTTRRWGSPRAGAWESVKRHFRELGTDVQSTDFTVGRHRRHVGRRVRQRDAAVAPHQAGRRLQPPARLPRPRPRTPKRASPSASGCSSCRARRGATTTSADLRGRRRLPAQRQVDPALRAGPRGARDRGRASCRPTS